MKRFTTPILAAGLLAALAFAPGRASAHFNVTLKDAYGNSLTPASTAPYSPKATCGGCHDYDEITAGYHFQQGFDELKHIDDRTSGDKPFIKSPGMYGKW